MHDLAHAQGQDVRLLVTREGVASWQLVMMSAAARSLLGSGDRNTWPLAFFPYVSYKRVETRVKSRKG